MLITRPPPGPSEIQKRFSQPAQLLTQTRDEIRSLAARLEPTRLTLDPVTADTARCPQRKYGRHKLSSAVWLNGGSSPLRLSHAARYRDGLGDDVALVFAAAEVVDHLAELVTDARDLGACVVGVEAGVEVNGRGVEVEVCPEIEVEVWRLRGGT